MSVALAGIHIFLAIINDEHLHSAEQSPSHGMDKEKAFKPIWRN